MTRPITFQEAQQAVAEKYGRIDWSTVIYEDSLHTPDLEQMYIEAAELLARSWANYYAEKQREEIASKQHRKGTVGYELLLLAMKEIPLPFPEER